MHDHPPAQGRRRGLRRLRLLARERQLRAFDAPAVVLATGGIGKSLRGHVQLLGVHRRRPRPGPARRRQPDQHGVHPVSPHGHGLAALGQGHPRHRVGARRRRGAAQLRGQALHVRLRPGRLQGQVRRPPRRRATAGTPTRRTTAARRSCCRATRSPAPSTPRSRPVAAPRTAASSSTSRPGCPPRRSSGGCRRCTTSSRNWPTSTSPRSRWRSAPPATTSWAASRSTRTPRGDVPGLFAAGEVLRRHARLQPSGRQLAVGPAGVRPSGRARCGRRTSTGWRRAPRGARPTSTPRARTRWRRRSVEAGEPVHVQHGTAADDERPGRHHPHAPTEIVEALDGLEEAQGPGRARRRAAAGVTTRDGTSPSTCEHAAGPECVAKAALLRQESRGGHTRDDYPAMRAEWRQILLVGATLGTTPSSGHSRADHRCGQTLWSCSRSTN